jgi:hypothetical protein
LASMTVHPSIHKDPSGDSDELVHRSMS